MTRVFVKLAGLSTFFCIAILNLLSSPVVAETIEVRPEHALAPKSFELPAGAMADVIVMVTSAGEMVSNFNVILTGEKDKTAVAQGTSDANGEVLLSKIAPGKYVARLVITFEKRRRTTVEIGDVILRVSQ